MLTQPDIDGRLKTAVRNIAPYHDWIVSEMETDKDHIHILLLAPPRYSPSKVVRLIKSWTQRKIFLEQRKIRAYLWGGKLWAQGYYVSTILG